MKTILVTAYDVNPYKGSESGMGWNFSCQISRSYRTLVITRKNNKTKIEQYQIENKIENDNLYFFYYDLPKYLRFWKKGERGASLYFYLWQLLMPFFIMKHKLKFDIVHNLNFHADSYPSTLWVFGKPFVWGPINHNELIPKNYIKNIYSTKEYFQDRLKWMFKLFFWYIDPFHFLSRIKSDIILGANSSVKKRLRIPGIKFIQFPSVGAINYGAPSPQFSDEEFNVLVVGRFITIKAIDLAILSFNKFCSGLEESKLSKCQLTIVGRGPKDGYLVDVIETCEHSDKIRVINWLELEDLLLLYKRSNLFFFPSHEGAGMVVAEAMSHGLPILCFNNFGPGEFVMDSFARRIEYSDYRRSVESFASELAWFHELSIESRKDMSQNAYRYFAEKFDWDQKGDELRAVYEKLLTER